MTRRLNRRTLIGGSMEIIGAAGFGSLAFAAEEEAAPSPPPDPGVWRGSTPLLHCGPLDA